MSNRITRRNLFQLAGGSALGMLLSPVPWKLLDDSAIWTQNWSLTPKLPRGPISIRNSHCTLCPGGCGIAARCVGGHPYGLRGTGQHPVNSGFLCAVGLAGHHYAYHPLRIDAPCRFTGREEDSRLIPASLEALLSEMSGSRNSTGGSRPGGSIAILDSRPGRSVSQAYQEMLSRIPGSVYLTPPSNEESTLEEIRQISGVDGWGFDFENTHTILSFGAPLLDGWGTPGRIARRFFHRSPKELILIQAESYRSRTAVQASRWLALRPGTEAVLAMALAQVLLQDGLCPTDIPVRVADWQEFKELAFRLPIAAAAEKTGLPVSAIVEVAHALAGSSSIVLGGCDPGGGPLDRTASRAIACLNILLGNIDQPGGIISRREAPGFGLHSPRGLPLSDVADHSIRWMIIDSAASGYSFPLSLLQHKLMHDKGRIVCLSPYMTPIAAYADYIIPTPAHLESLEEVGTPPGAPASSWGLSAPLLPRTAQSVDPLDLIPKMSEALGFPGGPNTSRQELLKQRAAAIMAARQGTVFHPGKGAAVKVSTRTGTGDFWNLLLEGGCWVDDPTPPRPATRFTMLGKEQPWRERLTARLEQPGPSPDQLVLMPVGWKNATSSGSVPPMISKLFQESDCRSLAGTVLAHPDTAASAGISSEGKVRLQTRSGEMEADLKLDPALMPGVLHGAVGPCVNQAQTLRQAPAEGLLALCPVEEDGSWRITPAQMKKA